MTPVTGLWIIDLDIIARCRYDKKIDEYLYDYRSLGPPPIHLPTDVSPCSRWQIQTGNTLGFYVEVQKALLIHDTTTAFFGPPPILRPNDLSPCVKWQIPTCIIPDFDVLMQARLEGVWDNGMLIILGTVSYIELSMI